MLGGWGHLVSSLSAGECSPLEEVVSAILFNGSTYEEELFDLVDRLDR